ncbi:homeobox protein MSX-1-like [Galendromus occidentalis]|uniref:Homeobox protein MSX-1-like n=1 Tax=Galendromus occidentalis TaxID=34638 RepID=A0AAJ7SHQ4_9ACAR|nr:homeobox protein MSX-1-like [Galendromus occidentalis]
MTDLEQKKRNFSIESILQRGASCSSQGSRSPPAGEASYSRYLLPAIPLLRESGDHFDWISCTRYNPPRLQRKFEGQKKRKYLSRSPRIPFNSEQLAVLEGRFKESPYLSGSEVQKLARDLHMSDVRVKIWFQNRRAREKREKQAKSQTDIQGCSQTQSETQIATSKDLIFVDGNSDDPPALRKGDV